VTRLPVEEIGNAYARRMPGDREKRPRLPHLPDEDEPGPAGTGRALHLPEWDSLLTAAFRPEEQTEREALAQVADLVWVQMNQLAQEAREEARQLRAALRRARRLAAEEQLPALGMAVEDVGLGDDGMREAAEYLRRQAEVLLDKFLVVRFGERGGLGWMKRVMARYDRWRAKREGWPELDAAEAW
jgi:hypothetical protein